MPSSKDGDRVLLGNSSRTDSFSGARYYKVSQKDNVLFVTYCSVSNASK